MKTKLLLLFLFLCTIVYSQVYVNKTATGANDGTSWANAYIELADAMANHNGVDFWVASGTYKPITTSADPRDAEFRLLNNDKIYGGFGGSETLLSQRNPAENPTILSGDLNGDDNAVIVHNESTRQDNSYHVVRVYGDAWNLVIDGVSIIGGNANASLLNNCNGVRKDRRKGAAILVQPNIGDRIYMTVINCIIEKNTATDTSVYADFHGCGQSNVISDTDFVNCVVRDNHSDTNGAFMFTGATQYTQRSRGSITNSVLYNNTSTNGAAGLTVINSSGGSSSGTDVQVINTTLTKNTGFNGNTMKIQKAETTYLRNTIVWGNNSGVALNISNGAPYIQNTIVEGGQGGTNADPLFIDVANDDFQIQLASPAFNTGENSYLPAGITQDVNGENRIFATTIDLGAYEYSCSSCNVLNTTVVGNGSVSPTGGVYGVADVVTLMATADAGWMFSSWSGDFSGNANPETVTMSASKTITATFIETPTFVDINATGTNNGSSWANAYTDLKIAIANTTAGKEIWVAEGVYVPSGSSRTAAFDIQKVLKIYGGFSGVETAISQRNGGKSILSGDRNGNDNATLTDMEPTRQDNSYHVFMVRRHIDTEPGVLDGFTISGGNSNHASAVNGRMGAAVYANPFSYGHRVKWKFENCTIEKNTSSKRGAVFAMFSASGVQNVRSIIDFESCIIRDNYSKDRENIYYSGSNTYYIQGNGSIINSLIYNNKTDGANRGAALLINGGTTHVDVINSTFANNISPNNHVIKLNLTNSSAANIKNNIIYNNGSTQPIYLTGNTPTFSNNIVEGGQLGNTNANPLFMDATVNDFTLQSGSPAIDAGDDSFITGFTTDLIGNTRTNNTVDLGCFEYNATLRTLTVNKVGSGVLNPLVGIHSYTTGANIVLTATPNPGWTFTGWTGTTTEANTSFSVVLNNNMTYTASFTENPTTYVDMDATGAGDGTSWANAFTNLTDALVVANSNLAITQVWIAEGTYIPHASDVFTKFEVAKENLTLYGGFVGTETLLSDRDLTANHFTILSGDLNDDDAGVGFGIGSRNNNSMHIMQVYSSGVVLDGLHFEDGNAFGAASSSNAGAVYINGSVNDITFKNCEFNNNVGKLGGTIYAKYTTNATLTIENCIFNNNYSRYGSGVCMLTDGAYTVDVNVTNTLFSNNKTVNYNVGGTIYKGYTGSAMWLRANTAGSNVITTITNSTFVGNLDLGTIAGSERGALALSRRSDGTSTHNATINNSIFYNNERNGVTTRAINHGHQIDPNTVLINNSIDEDDFSNISSGDKTATSNANPLFISSTDFTLQTASPARNTGDNSKVSAGITTDLAGNSRIQDTTVDMGCYESSPLATYTLTTTVTGTGTVSPNGASSYTDGTSVSITATAGTGWQFDHWVGDASGNTNPLSITMNANKSVEAVFTLMQFTLTTSVNGNGIVTPSGANIYNYGDTVTITATPDTGSTFVRFDITDSNGTTSSTNTSMGIVIGEDISMIAIFQTTALINDEEKLRFNFYPNPVSEILNIILDTAIKEITIYDSLGRLVLVTNRGEILVGSLSSGMYFVEVQDINSKVAVKKFIKK